MAKIVFVQDIVYEYFGIMHISSYLKQNNHDCDVIIEFIERDWLKKLIDSKPDIIGFSVLTGSFNWALKKAALIKQHLNVPILFGGVHTYLNPVATIAEPAIDAICTGEGEIPLTELLDSIDAGAMSLDVSGFWFKLPDGSIKRNKPAKLYEKLDELPFPDRSIYYKYKELFSRDVLPMLGSRGCPYDCTYCVIPSAKILFKDQGKFVRERSPENILAEIEQVIKYSPKKKFVHFVEDHFGNNRQLALKVLNGLSKFKDGKLGWGGAIRVERFNKEEYVAELSKTNHGMLGIAVECGDEDYRRDVLKRPVTNEQIINAARLATKYGIKFDTLNMVGLPGETFDQALMTLDLNIKLKPVYANCYVYQPYPGTILQKYSVEHGLMDDSVSKNLGLSFYDRYWANNKELNLIINIQRIFGIVTKFPILKRPLVWLARHNWRVIVDLIFGLYYMWWLIALYKLGPRQIFIIIKVWVNSRFEFSKSPSNESIRYGEGQFSPYSER